jgi:gamma-glutamyltranspeptidase/glutathione hydrolase
MLVLGACHSTPPGGENAKPGESKTWDLLSENHINYEKFNRTNTCCSATGRRVAVASGGDGASKAAIEIYEKGGNAMDAVVAAAFCVVVEREYAVGLGGGGFMTAHLTGPKGGDFFVDFRETAPRHAQRDMFIGKDGKVDSARSQEGGLAVGVPGLVAGLYDAHQKWGKLSWKQVLEPSIRLARDGVIIQAATADRLEQTKTKLTQDPYLTKLLQPKPGEWIAVGDKFVQKDLAQTLTTIAKSGKKAFYTGAIAIKMVDAVKKRGGILDLVDLKNYQTKFREPVSITFKGYRLISAPPPSSGGLVAAQTLGILDAFDLKKESEDVARYSHLLAETFKRAYADRSVNVGDPDFFKSDWKLLFTPEYVEAARKNLKLGKAVPAKELKPGEFIRPRRAGTSNVQLIDSDGNAISVTISGNGPFGAFLAVPGTGILMNDTMDDFTLKVGETNMWGVVSGEGNAIVPGKRPLSSMMPTVILTEKDKMPVLSVGGAGGARIMTSVIQTILNDLFLFNGDIKRAVTAPRIHHQWLPDTLSMESGYSAATQEKVKALGYEVNNPPFPPVVSAVSMDPATKQITAALDPRTDGGAEAK